SGATVAGPSIAGAVYQALTDVTSPKIIGGALTCAVDAVGYLAATLALLDIRKPEPKRLPGPGEARADFFGEMREGIHIVMGNPLLTRIAGCTATSNLGAYIVGPAMLVFALNHLGYSPFEWGLLGTVGAIGFLVGAIIARRVTDLLGFGRGLAFSISIGGLAVAYPLAMYGYPFVLPFVVAFIIGTSSPIYNIRQISL